MKKTGLFLLITFLPNFFFLFSNSIKNPPLQFEYNYIKINNYMGIHVNSDAFAFIGAAIQPGYLLQDQYYRQSRPVYVLSGTVLGYAVYYATYPIHSIIKKKIPEILSLKSSQTEKEKGLLYFSFYVGFIMLNIAVVFFSLLLTDKIIHYSSGTWKNGWVLYVFILLTISGNNETKYFFWTPHQQLFNILTPLLSIYTGLIFLKKEIPASRIFQSSFCCGLLFLMYGNFILLFLTILGGSLCSYLKRNLNFTSIAKKIGISIFFFALPSLIWVLILSLKGVAFSSSEINSYRQFIWIIDAAKISTQYLLHQIAINTWDFLQTLGSLLLPSLLPAITVLYFLKNNISLSIFARKVAIIPFFICIAYVLFFWLLGYYADRLTFSMMPFILYYFTFMINQQTIDKRLVYILISLISVSYLWLFFFEAPHFSKVLFFN